jgi:hypothetical protein
VGPVGVTEAAAASFLAACMALRQSIWLGPADSGAAGIDGLTLPRMTLNQSVSKE